MTAGQARPDGSVGAAVLAALGGAGTRSSAGTVGGDSATTSARDGSGTTRTQALVSSGYRDFCDDATGDFDLSSIELLDDGATTAGMRWTACVGTDPDSSTGAVVVEVVPLDGTDHVTHVFGHELAEGTWFAARLDANGQVVESLSGPASLSTTPQPNGDFTFDAEQLDLPLEYLWVASSFAGADDARVDRLPEPSMPPTINPYSCDQFELQGDGSTSPSGRTSVTTTGPGATTAVAAALRDAGHWVGALGTHGLSTWPTPTGLRGLPGVVDVAPASALVPAASDDPAPTAWAQDQLQLDGAWAATGGGTPAVVAVLDEGVNGRLSDFGGRVGSGWNAAGSTRLAPGTNSALGHHGTSVSSVLAATHGDRVRTAGVNNDATVMPVLVADHALCLDDSVISAGIDAAVRDGADVINLSLGGPSSTPRLAAAVEAAVDAGVVVVAATGNQGTGADLNYPAGYPGVLGVGASNRSGQRTGYSVVAGEDMLAPGGAGNDPISVLDRYGTVIGQTGTSFSTPYVAGVASLLVGSVPGRDIADHILAAVSHDGILNATAALDGVVVDEDRPAPTPYDSTEACAPFTGDEFGFDDTQGGVFDDLIRCIGGHEITVGFSDGTYRPAGTLLRGQTAAFIRRALLAGGSTLPSPDDVPDAYTDDDGTLFEDDLDVLAAIGVPPTAGDRVQPGAVMTRARMAEWVASALRVAGAEPSADPFDWFADDDGHPREAWIDDLASFGVVTGTGPSTFSPGDPLTRGQMSVFLARTVAVLLDADVAP